MKKITLIGLVAIFAGCSSIPSSPPIGSEAAKTFFTPSSSTQGTIYFTCGKWYTKTAITDSSNESPVCDFIVNKKPYTQLKKGSVGRLDLPPGMYEISQGENSMSTSVPAKIDLKAGGIVLAIANYTHKTGVLGGAMTGNHIFSVEIITTGVVTQIQNKSPVQLAPLP